MIDIKELEKSLEEIIQNTVKDEKFKVREEEDKRKINIYTGILPPDPEETIIPAITIRTIQAKNSLENKILTVQISIGIFDESTENGYIQISKITQMIFDDLIETGILKNRFEILPNGEWYHPEAQPVPYYLGFITLNVIYEKNYRRDLENWINGED